VADLKRVPSIAAEVVDLLKAHRTLGGAPNEELEWLAAHGELHHIDKATLLTPRGEAHPFALAGLESLIIHFSGRMVLYADHGAGPHKVMEWTDGDVNGYLPYSRMSGPGRGEMVVTDPIDALLVHRVHFPEMIRECPWVTTTLVHVMLDRARHFRASELQDEKMKSLGKLAAGLAHELNNPASASARSAHLISEALNQANAAARSLRTAGLSDAQFEVIDRVRDLCGEGTCAPQTGLAHADREDALAEWLGAHGADTTPAAALADTRITIEMLDELAAAVTGPNLDSAIVWLANDWAARALLSDIERATTHIATLVGAVKRFTYMDRALTSEAVTVAESVDDTIVLLQPKIREKAIRVDIQIATDLPPARVIGSDLNQLLIYVIDNAIDAAPEGSRIAISAEQAHDRIVVRVVDHGAGIPPDVRARIFDPFFTTKPVGRGTGLGLSVARHLVRRNDGDIEVDSTPERTEFRVIVRMYANEAPLR